MEGLRDALPCSTAKQMIEPCHTLSGVELPLESLACARVCERLVSSSSSNVASHCLNSNVQIVDGGVCFSTADWQITRENLDRFGSLRKSFGALAKEWDLLSRFSRHVEEQNVDSLFQPAEIEHLKSEMVSFLSGSGFKCRSVVDRACCSPKGWRAYWH